MIPGLAAAGMAIGWHELGHPLVGWEVLGLTLWGLLL